MKHIIDWRVTIVRDLIGIALDKTAVARAALRHPQTLRSPTRPRLYRSQPRDARAAIGSVNQPSPAQRSITFMPDGMPTSTKHISRIRPQCLPPAGGRHSGTFEESRRALRHTRILVRLRDQVAPGVCRNVASGAIADSDGAITPAGPASRDSARSARSADGRSRHGSGTGRPRRSRRSRRAAPAQIGIGMPKRPAPHDQPQAAVFDHQRHARRRAARSARTAAVRTGRCPATCVLAKRGRRNRASSARGRSPGRSRRAPARRSPAAGKPMTPPRDARSSPLPRSTRRRAFRDQSRRRDRASRASAPAARPTLAEHPPIERQRGVRGRRPATPVWIARRANSAS